MQEWEHSVAKHFGFSINDGIGRLSHQSGNIDIIYSSPYAIIIRLMKFYRIIRTSLARNNGLFHGLKPIETIFHLFCSY